MTQQKLSFIQDALKEAYTHIRCNKGQGYEDVMELLEAAYNDARDLEVEGYEEGVFSV